MNEIEKILIKERALRSMDFVNVAGLMWDTKATARRKAFRDLKRAIETFSVASVQR